MEVRGPGNVTIELSTPLGGGPVPKKQSKSVKISQNQTKTVYRTRVGPVGLENLAELEKRRQRRLSAPFPAKISCFEPK